jgi:predicted metal-dependent peptidase
MNAELEKSLERAKMNVLIQANSTFISTILFSLHFKWSEAIPTAATNGKSILINPEFWNELDKDEQIFLLLHEAWHVAFEHMLRLNERDMRLWNMACDYVINLMLDTQGLRMPEGGLLDYQYDEMSSEEVYEAIKQDPDAQDSAADFVPDLQEPDDAEDSQGNGAEPTTAEQVKDIIIRASVRSQMTNDDPGSIPREIKRWIDEILNPKLPWGVILENFMKATSPDDYSLRKVNRRFLPDFYLPTLFSESLDEILIAVDTSGSITEDQLKAFLAETHEIAARLAPKKLTLVDFDWQVHQVVEINSAMDLQTFEFKGGGGTDLEEVCELLDQRKPDISIIFTDGYFHTHTLKDPNKPVIWAIHSNQNDWEAPFGSVLKYPM